MSWATAVVLIVAIGALAGVLQARYRAKAGIIADKEGNESFVERDNSADKEELEQLRERVKVLERIATDPARRTAEEIEKLRDER
ncbi:hypothetical protein [Parerythrobacter jejuensis]|uniref:Uncharacterized protein n=1 Tax=Parerythrobacter jejuensis TaxID=795812 RepID=A0A845ANS9_9SPHN|nr:hypothetical protein [Parerythrobacter jejuensis]MXP31940.1 hypothetical protein [Parerythrobacter jejuensis]